MINRDDSNRTSFDNAEFEKLKSARNAFLGKTPTPYPQNTKTKIKFTGCDFITWLIIILLILLVIHANTRVQEKGENGASENEINGIFVVCCVL